MGPTEGGAEVFERNTASVPTRHCEEYQILVDHEIGARKVDGKEVGAIKILVWEHSVQHHALTSARRSAVMNGWGWIKSMAEVLGAGTLTHLLGPFFVQGLSLGRRGRAELHECRVPQPNKFCQSLVQAQQLPIRQINVLLGHGTHLSRAIESAPDAIE